MRLAVPATIAPTLLDPVCGSVPAQPDCPFAAVLPEPSLPAGWQDCCASTSAATTGFGAGGVIVVGVTVVGGAVVGGGGGVHAKLIVNPPENRPSGPRRTETVTVSDSRVIVPGVVSMMASASRSTSRATTVLEPEVMIRSLFGCVD